jgi:hypothetical protein
MAVLGKKCPFENMLQCPLVQTRVRTGSYLSIDLDYWDLLGGERALRFLGRVFALCVPIYVCGSHESLLLDPEITKVRKLLNVDFHSDYQVWPQKGSPLTCGNWVNHVSWKQEGVYVWHFPSLLARRHGDCHDGDGKGPFEKSIGQAEDTLGGYQKAFLTQGLPALTGIAAVGISFDATWFLSSEGYLRVTDFLLNNLYCCRIDTGFSRCLQDYQQRYKSVRN